jgi:3-dehydroquinate dehydratase / shikimate dehydrogenase
VLFTLLIPHGRSPILNGEGGIASIFGSDRICAVIAAATSAEAVRQLQSAMGPRGRSRVLELRLDYLRDAAERTVLLRWVSRHLVRQHAHRASYQASYDLARQRREPLARRMSPNSRTPLIVATCRRRAGGGKFTGSVQEELEILAQAVRAGCLWCDVEIETAGQLGPGELRTALSPAGILVSAHDFRRLPPRLPDLLLKLRRCDADAVKVAAVCRSLADTHRLLAIVGARPDIVAVPMGAVNAAPNTVNNDVVHDEHTARGDAVGSDAVQNDAVHNDAVNDDAVKDHAANDAPACEDAAAPRILALREGAALTYAAVESTTAPGQLSLDALKRVYRLNRVFGSPLSRDKGRSSPAQRTLGPSRYTRIFGVIGDPIAHSLSPLLHNTAFAVRRLDAIYLPFQVRNLARSPRNLADFIKAVKLFGISGFSVTLPHKQRILRYLDGCEPLAATIGAVNTVIVRRGRLYGYNTDYVGVLRAIESRVSLRGSRVLLVGAGGAARAAAFALTAQGAHVSIWARRRAQARALARAAGGEAVERAVLRRESFDAVVNCTPVGMHSTRARVSGSDSGRDSPLEPSELNCRVVMDLIYRPQKTELLYLAERRGIETISGVEMFLAQGIAQWEMWMGESAPRAAMRRAVIRALADEERASARRTALTAI